MVAQRKVKTSTFFPGLSYVISVSANKVDLYVEFKCGGSREEFLLVGGEALWAGCSDRFRMPAEIVGHCRETARALAAKLTGRKVA